MIELLAKNWKLIVSATLGFIFSWWIGNVRLEYQEVKHAKAIESQVRFDIEQCDKAKEPTNEANDVDKTYTSHLLDECVSKLQQSKKCVPVYISKPASGVKTTDQPEGGGINSAAIDAANIECQQDRNDLNVAKTWAQGYQKFISGL